MINNTKFAVKLFVVLTITGVILIAFIIYNLKSYRAYTDLDYCKELADKLCELQLNQFQCSSINGDTDNSHVIIFFRLKDRGYEKYNNDECVVDIAKVRNMVTDYLNNNPSNELNSKLITFCFQTMPGDAINMRNYDSSKDDCSNAENLIQPGQFQYYEGLCAAFPYANEFSDARIIDLMVKENDDLTVLEEWNNLEYLKIHGGGLTEEKKNYLIEILPDCTVSWNYKIITETRVENDDFDN